MMDYNHVSPPYKPNDYSEHIQRFVLLSIGAILAAILLLDLLQSSNYPFWSEPYSNFSEISNLAEEFSFSASQPKDLTNTKITISSPKLLPNPLIIPREVEPAASVQNPIQALPNQIVPPVSLNTVPLEDTITIKSGDSLAKILTRYKVNVKEIQEIQLLPLAFGPLNHLQVDHKLTLKLSPQYVVQQLTYAIDKDTTLVIFRHKHQYKTRLLAADIEEHIKIATITIQTSLIHAIKNANFDLAFSRQLLDIFDGSVDLAHEPQKGSQITVMYEEYYKDGKPLRVGDIIAAKFVNKGTTYQVIGNVDANALITNYYTPLGESLRKALLRSPVHYTHISSPFNLHRMHPILHIIRPHKGVDMAAPSGSTIVSTGDGKIIFMGTKGGYGNVAIIRHDSKYTTIYGHMAGFAKELKRGDYVKRGQTIGYVGMTGLATGPHLHFELRINGVAYNPMTVNLPQGAAVASSQLVNFKQYAHLVTKELTSLS